MLTKEHIKQTLEILNNSFQSEDTMDYGGEDSWGPAMGAAASEAKIFNKSLRKLIKSYKKELEELNSTQEKNNGMQSK